MKNCGFFLAGLIAMNAAMAASEMTVEENIIQWREARAASLKSPDGWLSLIGLHWLSAGHNRVGAGSENDIVLSTGPNRVGDVIVEQGEIRFCAADNAEVKVNGKSVDCAELTPDTAGQPDEVSFGSVMFYVIERDDRFALRVKDSQAETLLNFTGLDYFPISNDWRIGARFIPYDSPHELEFPTVLGTIHTAPNPGRLVFEKGGETYDLDVIRYEGSDEFFIIFADNTNGKQTYPPGRFLYTPLPDDDGTVVLDFNKAYNPPCVFTAYATCPLPPPQNRLDLAVEAGELMYEGAAH